MRGGAATVTRATPRLVRGDEAGLMALRAERARLVRPIFSQLRWRGQRSWLAGELRVKRDMLLCYEKGVCSPDPKVIARACTLLGVDPREIDWKALAALRTHRGAWRKQKAA
jgi:hypothetical protein